MKTLRLPRLATVLSIAAFAAGCAQTGTSSAPAPAAAAPPPAAAPAAAPKAAGVPPGMNARGEVVDSKQVASGHGQKVKGIGNWEGEITGKPGPRSTFTKLQIGMSMKQVADLIGQPTDRGAYVTGKAWIPFYFGSDRHRYEFVYKNQGRLIFAGGSLGDLTGGNLIWIIHNGNEPGYR
jgi:hypothetical protein